MLGIGLIGLGKHGSRYVRHIVEDLTDAALVAVCRRNRPEGEKLAAAYRCTFHDDYRDLVANPGVDAVVVAVPPILHPAIVEAACRAGKPLLIEKPLATSLPAAQRIASLVSASRVRAMVAHTLRFNRTVQTVQAHVPEIGPLHALYLSQRFEPSPLDWLDRRAAALCSIPASTASTCSASSRDARSPGSGAGRRRSSRAKRRIASPWRAS